MAETNKPSEREIASVLSGVATPAGLETLSQWAEEMRAFAAEPDAKVAAAQISSLASIAASAPTVTTAVANEGSRLQRLRKRLVLSSLLSGMVAKVFAASVALATVTGGVAATGALPDAVQDPLAGIYNSVGFEFPTSGDCDSADDCSDSEDPDQEPASDPEGGPSNTNGNKKGPNNTEGNKNGPGENNPNNPGENNGEGPGNNNGKGPGENNGKGPGENNGEGPGSNNGKGSGNNSRQDGGDEG